MEDEDVTLGTERVTRVLFGLAEVSQLFRAQRFWKKLLHERFLIPLPEVLGTTDVPSLVLVDVTGVNDSVRCNLGVKKNGAHQVNDFQIQYLRTVFTECRKSRYSKSRYLMSSHVIPDLNILH